MAQDTKTVDFFGVAKANPWVYHIIGARHLDKESIPELRRLAELPTKDPAEAPIHAICEALERAIHFSLCITQKVGTAIRTEVAKEEKGCRAKHALQASIDPTLLKETIEPWKRLLCVIARQEQLKASGKHLPPNRTYFFLRSQQHHWDILWKMASANKQPKSWPQFQRMEIACLEFCVELLGRDSDAFYPSPTECAIGMMSLTPSGWQTPQEYCAMLKDILYLARVMIIGRSCVLAMDRTELMKEWGLGYLGASLDSLKLEMGPPEVGIDVKLEGSDFHDTDNFFGQWVAMHANWFMTPAGYMTPSGYRSALSMPGAQMVSAYNFGQRLDFLRTRHIQDRSDDRISLEDQKELYDELLKCWWEGGEGERVRRT